MLYQTVSTGRKTDSSLSFHDNVHKHRSCQTQADQLSHIRLRRLSGLHLVTSHWRLQLVTSHRVSTQHEHDDAGSPGICSNLSSRRIRSSANRLKTLMKRQSNFNKINEKTVNLKVLFHCSRFCWRNPSVSVPTFYCQTSTERWSVHIPR